jgi:transcriptional regulator with XRE-family HTH domain
MYLKNLIKIRKRISWSQEKLAAESGVSYSTLIKIESGRIDNPRIGTAIKFAKALKVSLDDLVK